MKRIPIKPYLLKLIKENILYIACNILLIVLIIAVIKISNDKIAEASIKNTSLTNDVRQLQTRYNLLNSVSNSGDDIDIDIQLLNSLVPNAEDYFSIIYALEKISQKTGFVITSYTVNVTKTTTDKLRLSISGKGDTTTFLNFLQSYNYEGGRLITSDKIELNAEASGVIKMNLTFYNKKVGLDYSQPLTINKKTIDEVTALKNKINFAIKESSVSASVSGNTNYSYPIKDNPF